MKLTGQKLKEKREAARLTISEVSLATKINPKVIAAMENGDIDTLPAKTFLRGFVRSYAGYLKMNVSEVMAIFNQEFEEKAPEAPAPMATPNTGKVDVNGDGSNAIRMVVVGSILLLIVLIIGVRSLIQKYEREKMTETTAELSPAPGLSEKDKSAGDDSSADEPTPTPSAPASLAVATPSPSPSPVAEVKLISPTPPPSPSPVATNSPRAIPSPTPTVRPTPSPVAHAEPKPTPTPSASTEAASTPTPAPKGRHHEIILEALDKVEVKFRLKGQDKSVALAPNEVHTIIADEPVTLDISDGGALNITDNGRDKGPAGDLGHPKKVSIP